MKRDLPKTFVQGMQSLSEKDKQRLVGRSRTQDEPAVPEWIKKQIQKLIYVEKEQKSNYKQLEFALGDKVYLDYGDIQEVGTVIGIWKDGNIQVLGQSAYVDDAQNDITPIPITPKILKENGFVEDGDQHNGGYYYDNGDSYITHRTYDNDAAPENYTLAQKMYKPFPVDEWFFESKGTRFSLYFEGDMVRYLHQLQHILRGCGLEELADNFNVT